MRTKGKRRVRSAERARGRGRGYMDCDASTIKRLVMSLYCHGLIGFKTVDYLFRKFPWLKNV
jgi:hypothetical protein